MCPLLCHCSKIIRVNTYRIVHFEIGNRDASLPRFGQVHILTNLNGIIMDT